MCIFKTITLTEPITILAFTKFIIIISTGSNTTVINNYVLQDINWIKNNFYGT